MKPIDFIDMQNGGGWNETEIARCLCARYTSGIVNHAKQNSAVICSLSGSDIFMENSRGGQKLSSCLNTKTGDIYGKHQRDDAVVIPVLTPGRENKRQEGRRFKENGDDSFTLNTQDRHGVAIDAELIMVKEATRGGYSLARCNEDSVNIQFPGSKTRRGRVGIGVANTLDTSCNQGIFVKVDEDFIVYAIWYEKYQCYVAIRKLTPRECFRLQGWTDDYFEKAEFVNSDSQLYKQAGNGVTVPVIEAIARKLV